MKTAPSINELFTSISTNLKSQFGISSENDLKRVLVAMASCDAGMLKILYLALLDVQKNILPDLADPESMGGTLERYGRLKLGRNPNPATQGRYTATFTGVIGTTISLGTQLVNKVTNTYYTVDASITLSSATGNTSILASKSGADTLQVGDILFTVNTIINLQSSVTVASVLTIPMDAEDLEVYRGEILKVYKLEPNGGSNSDYVKWALDIAESTNTRTVYPFTTINGQANIYIEGNTVNSVLIQSILDAFWKSDFTGIFEQSQDITIPINQRGRRPLGFTGINILNVTWITVDIEIKNLNDTSTAVQTAITQELTNLLYNKRPFVVGIGDINNRQDTLYFKDVVTSLDSILENSNTYDDVIIAVGGNLLTQPYQFNISSSGCICPYLGVLIYTT
jgi:hypothetical protein